MKIEELIQLHFYNKKEISLQGIGTFRLNPSAGSVLNDKGEIILPENAISFEYNPKVTEDTSLVETISLHTKKIKSLASSDLNSFVVWETQLLNIGMTFTLKGIGTLEKTKQGELKFIPYRYLDPEAEKPNTAKKNKNAISSALPGFKKAISSGLLSSNKTIHSGLLKLRNYRPELSRNSKRALTLIYIIVFVSTVIWASYHFAVKTKRNEGQSGETKQLLSGSNARSIPEDTAKDIPLPKNTIKDIPVIKDTSMHVPTNDVAALDKAKKEYAFKVVFLETKIKEEALKKYNEISGFGHSASIYTKDSSTFQIAFPFNLPLGDTSRIVDSLDQFYSLGKGFVDVK